MGVQLAQKPQCMDVLEFVSQTPNGVAPETQQHSLPRMPATRAKCLLDEYLGGAICSAHSQGDP